MCNSTKSCCMANAPHALGVRLIHENAKTYKEMTANLLSGYLGLAFVLALTGGAVGASVGTSHKRLCALISLGAGTLLGVTLFAILPESFEALSWWAVLLALASG